MYLSREMIVNTILKIDTFKEKLENLYSDFDIDVNENTGRRNALLSSIQEKVLSDELSKEYTGVENDGAPGKPDIVIGQINTELECKLTSGSGKKSRSYSLQTDYATIQNKEVLDYLYIITNKDMTEYSALYFEGLTPEDFCLPAEGSRGKARMSKKVAFEKATPLVVGFKSVNEENIKKYEKRIELESIKHLDKTKDLILETPSFIESGNFSSLIKRIKNEDQLYKSRVEKINDKISLWKEKENSYSIEFESLEAIKSEDNKNEQD